MFCLFGRHCATLDVVKFAPFCLFLSKLFLGTNQRLELLCWPTLYVPCGRWCRWARGVARPSASAGSGREPERRPTRESRCTRRAASNSSFPLCAGRETTHRNKSHHRLKRNRHNINSALLKNERSIYYAAFSPALYSRRHRKNDFYRLVFAALSGSSEFVTT